MKEVLELIASKRQSFAQLPLFKFLQDSTIDAGQRLAFAPIFAPFVMGFGELNSAVFREEPTDHPIQSIINQHSREDDSHWIWFLEDLNALGFDAPMSLSDALRFLWSDETYASRHVIYELYRYTYQASPIQKLVVVEAIEATADIFLEATAQAARDLQGSTKKEYRYFGELHFAVDSSHSLHLLETAHLVENLPLTDDTKQEAIEFVEKVFQIFTDYFSTIFAYAKNHEIVLTEELHCNESLEPAGHVRMTGGSRSSKQRQPHSVPVAQTVAQGAALGLGKRLGSHLIEAGLLTSEQLETALNEQERNNRRLGEVVSSLGWVNQETVEYLMQKVVLPDRETVVERSPRSATPKDMLSLVN
jgi:hypothetical protein